MSVLTARKQLWDLHYYHCMLCSIPYIVFVPRNLIWTEMGGWCRPHCSLTGGISELLQEGCDGRYCGCIWDLMSVLYKLLENGRLSSHILDLWIFFFLFYLFLPWSMLGKDRSRNFIHLSHMGVETQVFVPFFLFF